MTLCLAAAVAFTTPAFAQDDNPGKVCREAARLFDEDDIEGAIEEARWCLEALEQLQQQAAGQLFPDEINGFVGNELQSQSTMGMRIMEREYVQGNQLINVTYTGGGAAAGGLAAIARMGMNMGGTGKKMRIQRRTVIDMSDAQQVEFSVSMKSGGMLNITSSNVDHDTVLAFVKDFPIAELDDASQ
ncbi:MAG TPA: hypothetical protein DD979_18330 [Gammaproteobacteria bacterium]|nr:hypothetical protein [Gammaproteobacteria bacterium]